MMRKKPAILGDLGGMRIRFVLEDEEPIPNDVWDHKTKEFENFEQALQAFLQERRVISDRRELRMSLPGEIIANSSIITLGNLPKAWNIDRRYIENRYKVNFRPWNDAVAAFYSLFEMFNKNPDNPFEYVDIVKSAQSPPVGRFVLMGLGTGMGSAAAYRAEETPDGRTILDQKWIPIPSEFGTSFAIWPEELSNIVHKLRRKENGIHEAILRNIGYSDVFPDHRFNWREYILSGPGLIRIYHALKFEKLPDNMDVITDGKRIVDLAKSGNDEDAIKTLHMFCGALGQAVAAIAHIFTAHVGIYLTGGLLTNIGAEGLRRFGFIQSFEERRKACEVDTDMPIYLVKHPYPELVGLRRFKTR